MHFSTVIFTLLAATIYVVNADQDDKKDFLTSFVERMTAPSCVSNETHCNCARKTTEGPAVCYKPNDLRSGYCVKSLCNTGSSVSYQCDCAATQMCQKEKSSHYVPLDPAATGDEVECKNTEKTVLTPMKIEESCVSNSTHCHCAFAPPPAPGSNCLRPIPGVAGRCFVDSCGRGLQCDCASNTMCVLQNQWYYVAAGSVENGMVDCTRLVKKVPVLYVP